MKRIVRLTESDLARIVRRVMNEAPTEVQFAKVAVKQYLGVSAIYAPGEVETGTGTFYNFSEYQKGKLLSATITPTAEATKLGLNADSLKITLPASAPVVTAGKTTKQLYGGVAKDGMAGTYRWTFTTPRTKYVNSTGKAVTLFTIDFVTNDEKTPTQRAVFTAGANTQFGNSAAAGN